MKKINNPITTLYVCCSEECGWIGRREQCVTFKHVPDDLLCPRCGEVTEEYEISEADILLGIIDLI